MSTGAPTLPEVAHLSRLAVLCPGSGSTLSPRSELGPLTDPLPPSLEETTTIIGATVQTLPGLLCPPSPLQPGPTWQRRMSQLWEQEGLCRFAQPLARNPPWLSQQEEQHVVWPTCTPQQLTSQRAADAHHQPTVPPTQTIAVFRALSRSTLGAALAYSVERQRRHEPVAVAAIPYLAGAGSRSR